MLQIEEIRHKSTDSPGDLQEITGVHAAHCSPGIRSDPWCLSGDRWNHEISSAIKRGEDRKTGRVCEGESRIGGQISSSIQHSIQTCLISQALSPLIHPATRVLGQFWELSDQLQYWTFTGCRCFFIVVSSHRNSYLLRHPNGEASGPRTRRGPWSG